MNINECRKDFPILSKEFHGKKIVYLDNAAMTLKPRQVIEKMNEYYYEYSSITGRSTHKLAEKTSQETRKARESVQNLVNAQKPEEIIFTKNTTEAINLVSHTLEFKPDEKVLTTDTEHNSNLVPWLHQQKKGKLKHDHVKSNQDNTFNMEEYEKKLGQGNIKLVSMVWTSNLDGHTIPAEEITKKAHDYGALVLFDAAQAVPHKEVNVKKIDADFIAFSVHKMCGPTGMGVLYGKKKILEQMDSFITGGDTVHDTTYNSYEPAPLPEKYEAGLQNYAGIIGSGAAAEYIQSVGLKKIQEREHEINRIITEELSKEKRVTIIGPEKPEERGGITSFAVENADSHDIAIMLDETANIQVRAGRHCVHSWFNSKSIEGTVRASAYLYNTPEEAQVFCETLKKILKIV